MIHQAYLVRNAEFALKLLLHLHGQAQLRVRLNVLDVPPARLDQPFEARISSLQTQLLFSGTRLGTRVNFGEYPIGSIRPDQRKEENDRPQNYIDDQDDVDQHQDFGVLRVVAADCRHTSENAVIPDVGAGDVEEAGVGHNSVAE